MRKYKAMLWVKLLRSGEYKQGTGFLKQQEEASAPPRYCCLGVLCEVQASLKSKISAMEYWGLKFNNGRFTPRGQAIWPPSIPENSVLLRSKTSLADLNDAGATFDQIADFIELNYKLL